MDVIFSNQFFCAKFSASGNIIDRSNLFSELFPASDHYEDVVHPSCWNLIPKPDECNTRALKPLDICVKVRLHDGVFRAIAHIATTDNLIFYVTGFVVKDRTLEDQQLLDAIRAEQSHQARSPVAALLGLLQLLDRDSADFDRLKTMIHSEVERYDSIIRKINQLASQ